MNRRLPFHSNSVWPPAFMVGMFAFCYGMISVGLWLISLAVLRNTGTNVRMEDFGGIVEIRSTILCCAAGVYALFRLWRFHPACNHAYAAWLSLSPWTAAKPLPLGPIHPVWQDAAVIGVLTALAFWHAHADPALPVEVFGFAYLAGFTLLLAFTRRWWHCVALGFLWPALMLPQLQDAPALVITDIVAIIAIIGHGHRQSLNAFPWGFIKLTQSPIVALSQVKISFGIANSPSAAGAQHDLGWPYLALSPKMQPPSVSTRTNLAMSALLGWWCFCVIQTSSMEPVAELILLFGFVAALFRASYYCSGTTTPFNLWGRISSGRIIIPGFDRIFLTPLAVMLVAVLGAIIIKRSGPWFPASESGVMAMIWFILFGGGPTLRNWALTGEHRLRPTRSNANRQLVRPV